MESADNHFSSRRGLGSISSSSRRKSDSDCSKLVVFRSKHGYNSPTPPNPVNFEEFKWNLKRLIRESCSDGIFLHDIEEAYKFYFHKTVTPDMFSTHTATKMTTSTATQEDWDWASIFKKNIQLRQVFVLESVDDDIYKVKLRPNSIKPEETKIILAMTEYSNYMLYKYGGFNHNYDHDRMSDGRIESAYLQNGILEHGTSSSSFSSASSPQSTSHKERMTTTDASSQTALDKSSEFRPNATSSPEKFTHNNHETQTHKSTEVTEASRTVPQVLISEIENISSQSTHSAQEDKTDLMDTDKTEIEAVTPLTSHNITSCESDTTAISQPADRTSLDPETNIDVKSNDQVILNAENSCSRSSEEKESDKDKSSDKHYGFDDKNQQNDKDNMNLSCDIGKDDNSNNNEVRHKSLVKVVAVAEMPAEPQELPCTKTESKIPGGKNEEPWQTTSLSTTIGHKDTSKKPITHKLLNADTTPTISFKDVLIQTPVRKPPSSGGAVMQNLYKCTLVGCRQSFATMKEKQKHMIETHLLNGLKYKCQVEGCRKLFRSEKAMLEHSASCLQKLSRTLEKEELEEVEDERGDKLDHESHNNNNNDQHRDRDHYDYDPRTRNSEDESSFPKYPVPSKRSRIIVSTSTNDSHRQSSRPAQNEKVIENGALHHQSYHTPKQIIDRNNLNSALTYPTNTYTILTVPHYYP